MKIDFVIYRDVPVVVKDRHGNREWGDLPVLRYNEVTKQFEAVDNPRGYGYAGRNRISYRRKVK